MSDFSIKQGDTRPKLVATLLDKFEEEGQEPLDLSEAETVELIMRRKGKKDPAAPKVKAECDITDAKEGEVTYTWKAGDTDEVGQFNIEFQVTWGDGGIETVPNIGYMTIQVIDDLG